VLERVLDWILLATRLKNVIKKNAKADDILMHVVKAMVPKHFKEVMNSLTKKRYPNIWRKAIIIK